MRNYIIHIIYKLYIYIYEGNNYIQDRVSLRNFSKYPEVGRFFTF